MTSAAPRARAASALRTDRLGQMELPAVVFSAMILASGRIFASRLNLALTASINSKATRSRRKALR
jgi:hypothetical protein